jgi:hypothetical protein
MLVHKIAVTTDIVSMGPAIVRSVGLDGLVWRRLALLIAIIKDTVLVVPVCATRSTLDEIAQFNNALTHALVLELV